MASHDLSLLSDVINSQCPPAGMQGPHTVHGTSAVENLQRTCHTHQQRGYLLQRNKNIYSRCSYDLLFSYQTDFTCEDSLWFEVLTVYVVADMSTGMTWGLQRVHNQFPNLW